MLRWQLFLVALIATASTASAQSIFTVAGGFAGDGREATRTGLSSPEGIAVDAAGNIYIADTSDHRVRRVDAISGVITTVAGNGSRGAGGDGGLAIAAQLAFPAGVALDSAGNLYIADRFNSRIRKVAAGSGIITTVAGNGTAGFAGDGGPATAAQLREPYGVTLDAEGNLYIADTKNHRIRKVENAASGNGVITTVAGWGLPSEGGGFSGDGGAATGARLRLPYGVAVDSAGNLYIADSENHRVRKVTKNGIITTIAGSGPTGTNSGGFNGDTTLATQAQLNLPSGVALDAAGNLYIADSQNHRIRKVNAISGIITTVAGNGVSGFFGDGPAKEARLFNPSGVALDSAGNLFIADTYSGRIRKVTATTQIITTVAGNGGFGFLGDGSVATAAGLKGPRGVALDAAGNLYVADTFNERIRKVAAGTGIITTVAGNGSHGFSGDGGPASAAQLAFPSGVAVDSDGNLYIADTDNNRIRKVDASGIITTLAGRGSAGFSGDNGPATEAQLLKPLSVALDAAGNLYIADTENHRIRKVQRNGVITTVAGTGSAGFNADGIAATEAQLNLPCGVALDSSGSFYIADTANHRIRKVDAGSGNITTVAGTGSAGFSGDSGPAEAAQIRNPYGVGLDSARNLYFSDDDDHRVRKVDAGSRIITTVAGKGRPPGFSGDGGKATEARLNFPKGLAVSSPGDLYFADFASNRVRAVYLCVTVAAPALAIPVTGATGIGTAPELRWNKVAGAFRYDVFLSTSSSPALIGSDLTSTKFTPSNLIPGVTYFWRVEAKGDPFCDRVSKTSSETRSFTTAAACTAPGDFQLLQPANGSSSVSQSVSLSWQSAAGAATYDLYFGAGNPPVLFKAGLASTTFQVTNLTPNTTYYWSVVAHALCDGSKVKSTPVQSFKTGGGCSPAGAFSQTAPAGGASDVPLTTTLEWTPSTNASSYEVYLGTSSTPPLYLSGVTQTRLEISGLLPSRTYYWHVVAVACDGSNRLSSPTLTFRTGSDCPLPRKTAITFVPPGNVGVGQTYTIAWQELPDLDEEGFYIIERSLDPSFSQIFDSQKTSSASASFVANSAQTYYHRVHAVRGCDPTRAGSDSDVKSVNVIAGSANVIFTLQPQSVVTTLGEKLEDKRTSLAIENIGPSTLQVIIGKGEIKSVPFFTLIDPEGGDSVFVTLEPRKPKTFEVRFSGPPNDKSDAYQGLIFVAATGQGLAVTPYAFVNLKVGRDEATSTSQPVFVTGDGTPTEYAFFPGFPANQNDATRPPITTFIKNTGSSDMELGAEIGPEVWLVPEPGWNSTPIPAGATRPVRLFTKRDRAPNGSALPRYTYFVVRSKSGKSARLLVQDNDEVNTGAGRSSLLEPGRRSYIVPGVTSSSTGSTTVMSRLRLTNVGTEPVQTELFFTPAGSDGFDGAQVRRATVVVPPNDVVTLTDPLRQLFGLTPPANGQIEVRAVQERIGFLIVTASVITPDPTAAGGAQTYQLATLRLGEGARVDREHIIIGLDTSGSRRVSLTLADTTGGEATRVRVTLFDAAGSERGQTIESIARYGQKTIDLRPLMGGASIEGGRIQLTVESGGGAVTGVLTMLDATQNSGATLISQPADATADGSSLTSGRMKPAAGVQLAGVVVPVVLNGALPAGPAAPPGPAIRFWTSMGFTTTGATALATVVYRPADGTGEKSAQVKVSGGVVTFFQNVLEQLFAVPAGASARGAIYVQAPAGLKLFGQLISSAGPAGNAITGTLPIFGTLSEVLTSVSQRRPLYLDGLEQSIQSARGSRWSVVINETSGNPGDVTVQLYEAGNRSRPIAEKTIPIRAYEQIRLDTVFAVLGLDTDERRKDRTNVLCVVTAAGGKAVLSAVGVATDNVVGDTKHHLFSPNGGVPATGVSRVQIITPGPQTPVRLRGVRRGP